MTYKTLTDINASKLENFITFPLTGDPYFWGEIMLGIWFILTIGFFFEERFRLGKGNLLSSLAFSSFAIIVLSVPLTLLGALTNEIFIPIIIIGCTFIFIWYIKGE